MLRPRNIAVLYALFASLAILLLASTMPPLQNADEGAHTLRADQVSHLGFFAQRLSDGESGGVVDSGLIVLNNIMTPLPFHREIKVTRAMYAPLDWGDRTLRGFSNTAVYPPFFYLPAAAMIAMARHIGMPLPHALVLARMATGAATVMIGSVAIAFSGTAAIWLFAVMLLPMYFALSAAVTQDGPMLAFVALTVALYLHLRDPQAPHRQAAFITICVALALIGMARPPYAAFAVLALCARAPIAWRIAGFACIMACVAGWSAANFSHVVLPQWSSGEVNPSLQLHGLMLHPQRWPRLMMDTWDKYGEMERLSFIGYLGWLDVDLPPFYHNLAWAGLALAAIAAWCAGAGLPSVRDNAPLILAILGASTGVAIIQYMTWTVVGSPVIDGLQGRYFLAPSLLIGGLLARPMASTSPVAQWMAAPVLAFPILSIAVTVHALLLRYYF